MSNSGKNEIRSVCVFCGSSEGTIPAHRAAAVDLGNALLRTGIELVYGGGRVGLMGILADTVLAGGGKVIGVIPEMLAVKELLHPDVSPMHVVPSMHARKALMAELADAFVGGYGTFEELLEAITWAQLGIHQKPIGVLNSGGFYDPLVELIGRAVGEGFIKPDHRRLIVVEQDAAALLPRLATHRIPSVRKWIGPEET